MNIVFLTTTLPRFEGDGQSSFVFEQAQAWLNARPHDTVRIVAPDHSLAKKKEVIDGILIHRYGYFRPRSWQRLAYPALLPNIRRNPLLVFQLPLLLLSAVRMILELHKTERIDLLYAHWAVPNGLVAWVAKYFLKFSGRKMEYVVHNHSSDVRMLAAVPGVGKALVRSIIRNAQVFFCVNALLHDEALDLFPSREHRRIAQKIVVLPMGVNSETEPTSKKAKTNYDFGFIGRLTKKKGVLQLLNALSLLDDPVTVAIAGTGEEESDLRRAIRDLHKAKPYVRVSLLGHINGRKKEQFFSQCRALVLPSLPVDGDVEGIPVSMLEALLKGKIVVASEATNVRTLPEWTRIRSTVFTVADAMNEKELAGALKTVLELPNREILVRVGATQRYVSRYRWERLIHEYFLQLHIDR